MQSPGSQHRSAFPLRLDAFAEYKQMKATPGKPGANAALKECRERLRSPATAQVDEPGLRMIVTNEIFPNWAAYLAVHPQAKEISRSPIKEFAAKVFPERDPSFKCDSVITEFHSSELT